VQEARSGRATFSDISVDASEEDFRTYTLPVLHDGAVIGFVQVLHSYRAIVDTLQELLVALFAGGVFAMVAGGVGAYLLARRALAPIGRITRTAKRISANDLSARLGMGDTPEEVGQLATTFDSMLDRLEESFARERRFIADASHELRTPLAVMETILDVTTSEPRTATEYREALADLTDETGRLRALAENLLVSARQTQTPPAKLAPVDISLLAEDIGDALRPLAEAKSLQLRVTSEPGLMVMADSDTLVRALLNLVDNAIKYTERGGIDIRVSSKKDRVVLDVSDTGIGIPQNRQTDIFDRFCQLDSSRRSPGAGLGQNHGGTLRVRSSPGRGSTFTVALDRLPKSR
jgi:signal transduction histidine kinase